MVLWKIWPWNWRVSVYGPGFMHCEKETTLRNNFLVVCDILIKCIQVQVKMLTKVQCLIHRFRNKLRHHATSQIYPSHTHYSKSQIFVQKFNFDKTPTFSQVFHPNFFWQFFSWNQSCQQLKSPKSQHFHEFFTPKNRQLSREIKVEFLDKKWRFRTVWTQISKKSSDRKLIIFEIRSTLAKSKICRLQCLQMLSLIGISQAP